KPMVRTTPTRLAATGPGRGPLRPPAQCRGRVLSAPLGLGPHLRHAEPHRAAVRHAVEPPAARTLAGGSASRKSVGEGAERSKRWAAGPDLRAGSGPPREPFHTRRKQYAHGP